MTDEISKGGLAYPREEGRGNELLISRIYVVAATLKRSARKNEMALETLNPRDREEVVERVGPALERIKYFMFPNAQLGIQAPS